MKGLIDKEHDLNLLGDLFDHTYKVMKEAKGTMYTVGSEYVIERRTVLEAVESAIKKAEREALGQWRNNGTQND